MVQIPLIALGGALAILARRYFMPTDDEIVAEVKRRMLLSGTADKLGLSNEPPPADAARINVTAWAIGLPIMKAYPDAVVTSGYRSPVVNAAIPGASNTSDHPKGRAIDFRKPPRFANSAAWLQDIVSRKILKEGFDQLIAEHKSRGGHLHTAYRLGANRSQLKIAPSFGGYKTITTATIPSEIP